MKSNSQYKIISVGGSIIIPQTGFDIKFLKKFRQLILARVKKGEKFILIIGGGATCRTYQQAANQSAPLINYDLEMLGIQTTILNAYFVKLLFRGYVHDEVVINPTKKINTKKPIIVGAGWKPGFSTDTDAVILAGIYNVKEVFNLSNIEYVYDKDPRKFKDAKKLESLTFKEALTDKQIEVLDNNAISLCMEHKIPILVFDLGKEGNIEKAVSGQKIGTLIS